MIRRKVAMSACGLFAAVLLIGALPAPGQDIDMQRARELRRKQQQGQTLTEDEQQYLRRAMEQMGQGQGRQRPEARPGQPEPRPARPGGPGLEPKQSTGLVPLTDMGKDATYKGQDGGLYGQGSNEPPAAHADAARRELAKVQPLDAQGSPAADGKIVLISIGMSNTTQEFSKFVALANSDPMKNPKLVIVDGAIGGADVPRWVKPPPLPEGRLGAWENLEQRLKTAGVTPQQVQVLWMKQAKAGPAGDGEFPAHAQKLQEGMGELLRMLKQRYPNLRVAYLSSRIYAGYASGPLNPEPFAYEGGFAVRWLIQQQIQGEAKLNCDPGKGQVHAPLLLWGPYLWSDGTEGRQIDDLVYTRADLAGDGTHPSPAGQQKVAQQLLKFFQANPLASSWYTGEFASRR